VAPAFFYSGLRGSRGAGPRARGAKKVKPIPEIDRELEARIEAMGFELVEVEWRGSRGRPRLRVRVDRPDSTPGHGVTVDDCARVSRALERWLDEHPDLPDRYVLEVSSPGVERPLVRRRDFVRFAGREVDVRGQGSPEQGFSGHARGVLLGVEDEGEGYRVVIEAPDGSSMRVPRDAIERAKLVFRWDEAD
jgi:ribosome maturation factor RimP